MKQQTEQENMLHLPKFKSGEFFNTDIIKYTGGGGEKNHKHLLI